MARTDINKAPFFPNSFFPVGFHKKISDLAQDLKKADKVTRKTKDSQVVLATAESQGRIEVQEALEFQTCLANGTYLDSSAEKEKSKTKDDQFEDDKTLILGEEENQDPWTLQHIFPPKFFHNKKIDNAASWL